MMHSKEVDPRAIQAIRGSEALRGLNNLKIQLSLVQAACLLSLEGTTRATATQIVEKAITEYSIEATASYTGQVLSNLGINTATSHGKSRFILDCEQLEPIRNELAVKCQELAARLEAAEETFRTLPDQILTLEARWKNILRLRAQERELRATINEERKTPDQRPALEAELNTLREQALRIQNLKEECRTLSTKVKSLASLEEKKKSLEAAVAQYQTAEREIAVKEDHLKQRIARLRERNKWATLANLEEAIISARQELDKLSQQLGEKRSLLDRLLHRRGGGV